MMMKTTTIKVKITKVKMTKVKLTMIVIMATIMTIPTKAVMNLMTRTVDDVGSA